MANCAARSNTHLIACKTAVFPPADLELQSPKQLFYINNDCSKRANLDPSRDAFNGTRAEYRLARASNA